MPDALRRCLSVDRAALWAAAALAAGFSRPAAAVPPPPSASAPAVRASTQAASAVAAPLTVEDVYPGTSRDPFLSAGAGGARTVAAVAAPQEFSIHGLFLKGVMRDKAGDYAVLVSPGGPTYILKKGRLYDPKNKPIPGVTGKVFPAQKKVMLTGPSNDGQTLILGQDEKEEP